MSPMRRILSIQFRVLLTIAARAYVLISINIYDRGNLVFTLSPLPVIMRRDLSSILRRRMSHRSLLIHIAREYLFYLFAIIFL